MLYLKRKQGFTLIELALTILVMGFAMAGVLTLYNSIESQQKYAVTKERADLILRALSVYAQSAGRLPCPADPTLNDELLGWEYGVTESRIDRSIRPIGNCYENPEDFSNKVGIIPFQSLSIDPIDSVDGWGRYFTYAVSPVFVQENDQLGEVNDTGTVHAKCRTPNWVTNSDNENAVKARFCCAANISDFPVSTDIVIEHIDGIEVSPQRSIDGYNDVGVLSSSFTRDNIDAPAFVLISHGKNGNGAFLVNNSLDKFSGSAMGESEAENADGDNVFRVGMQNSGFGIFDDIVYWRTQEGIYAENGAGSCLNP